MTNNEKYQIIGTHVVNGMLTLKLVLPHITKIKGNKNYNKIIRGKWQKK